MLGNTSLRHANTSVLAVEAVDAPEVVTSASFDERLTDTYARLGLRAGLLEEVAGIRERRWWPRDTLFSHAAAMAGERAIEAAGIDRGRIGLLIDTSVSRDHLEPSAAVAVHDRLGLPSSCLNFDLANACLGFVNAMSLAGTMLDAGQIDYALIVDGEGARHTQEQTLARLSRDDATIEMVFEEFASLTLGSCGAAMVLGRSDEHPAGHRVIGSESRAGSQYHTLCVGTLDRMRTDTKALLDAGLDVAEATWTDAHRNGWDWATMDHYILHQVSSVHTTQMCKRLGIDPERAPLSFPQRGNVGPAAIPLTLALHQDRMQPGDRVLLGGIGSGVNTTATELLW